MPSVSELRDAFARFDANGDGFLSVDELVGILTRPGGGDPMTDADARAFVERHDKNGDGRLDLAEFAAALVVVQMEAHNPAVVRAAAAALAVALKAYKPAGATPLERARALGATNQWAQTWDGGATWHYEGDKSALPAALVAAEAAAKAAVEAQDLAAFGTTAPGSDDAAAYSWACAVTIGWLIKFTNDHDCWEWPTWRVVRDIVKPETAELRCRYADLPSVRATGAVGEATTFASHTWGAKWGGLVSALADGGADRQRARVGRHLRDPPHTHRQRGRPRLRRRRQPVQVVRRRVPGGEAVRVQRGGPERARRGVHEHVRDVRSPDRPGAAGGAQADRLPPGVVLGGARAAVEAKLVVVMKAGEMGNAEYPRGVHLGEGRDERPQLRQRADRGRVVPVNDDGDCDLCEAGYEKASPELKAQCTRVEPTVFSTLAADGCRAFVADQLMMMTMVNLIDIEKAECMIQADYDRELGKVRTAPGGTDGLNAAVRRMIGAGLVSCRQPEVQAAACGDDGALQLDGASAEQLTAWAKAAAGGGYDDLLRKLLEAGADPLTEDAGGMAPLAAAAQSGMAEAVRLCLAAAPGGAAAAAKRQLNDERTALFSAALGGHAEAMRVLLDAGADANQAEKEEAPLHVAAERPVPGGGAAAAREGRGGGREGRGDTGWTPLMLACDTGHLEAARLLLEKGAAVDAKNDNGTTALMFACQNGHVEAARLLLEKGAAVDAKTQKAGTA